MLVGRVKHNNRIFSVIFDNYENIVYEIFAEIEEILETIKSDIDISSKGIPVSEVEILIPTKPSKIVGIGRNYVGHVKELGSQIPDEPVIFFKPPSSLIPNKGEVIYPTLTERLEYEGELALVMRRQTKNVSAAEVKLNPQFYFGYTSFLDMTARDIQKMEEVWSKSKGFDTFGPIGPWINLDPLPESLKIRTFLNDEICQDDDIVNMIFKPEKIVEYVSQYMTLEIGDIIITGTPEGVGQVKEGDRIRLEISTLETLEVVITK